MKVRLHGPIYKPSTYNIIFSLLKFFVNKGNTTKIADRILHSPIGVYLDRIIDIIYPLTAKKDYVIIEKHDTWSCDETLSMIIKPLLEEFIKNLHGHPSKLNVDDVPESLRDKDGMVQWEWILGEMIWAFSQNLVEWEDQYWIETEEEEDDPFLITMCKYKHAFDKEAYRKHYDRMQNGYRLFGVYYNNLWD